jgi:DNA-binding helix-hairpin-helix protein with protein kinase domain
MLASFGVETAADVKLQAIKNISGFGPHLTDRLLSWRRSCEQKFIHRSDLQAPPDWLQRIRDQHQQTLAATATTLRGTLSEYRGVHSLYEKQLAAAATEIDQARRQCRAALNRAKAVWHAN